MNVPGSAVACFGGIPAAVMERQGKVLHIFEEEIKEECLTRFVQDFKKGKIFPAMKRIVVKEYPDTAKEALQPPDF